MSEGSGARLSVPPTVFAIGVALVVCIAISVHGCSTGQPAQQASTKLGSPSPQLSQANYQTSSAPAQPTGPTDMPSARTGGLLCVLPTAGLPRRFVPKDSGCPSQAPATPSDAIADSSVPAPGVTTFTAPPATDAANPGAPANWYVVRGHPGYTIYESIGGEIINDTPDHHDPRFRMACWDVLTNSFHVITTSWCYGSAFGFQSTSGEPLEMGYGFMPSARS